MKTIDLSTQRASIEDVLHLAEGDNLVVRTADGKVFAIAEVSDSDQDDDFAPEVALARQNKALRALLSERSREPGKHTLDQVRHKLGLSGSTH
jgi:hypothetical protein